MSAINPASFVTPTASLGPVPAFGAPALGPGRASPAGRRRQQVQGYIQPSHQPSQNAYEESYGNDRALAPQAGGPRNQYFNSYQYGAGAQQGAFGMQGYAQSTVDPFTAYNPYTILNPTAPNFASNQSQDGRSRGPIQPGGNNWLGRFQDLTLGS